jgi:hypothetical protein
MAEFRNKAQETAENLRALLVTIETGETPTVAEAQLAQVLTGVPQQQQAAQPPASAPLPPPQTAD